VADNVKTNTSERIYHTVLCVPKGRVASYGLIADLAGLPGRSRAVGYWLKRASSELILPWHRIIRADGKIAFPQGSEAFAIQRSRLVDEGVWVKNGRVNLAQFGWEPDLSVLLQQLKF